jgi:Arc/MetJ-type ribon-helix-helix transcriptional regulator
MKRAIQWNRHLTQTKEGSSMKKQFYTKAVSVSMEASVHDEIRRITDKEEMSMSEWIREAIRMRFHQEGIDTTQLHADQNNSVKS